VSADHAAVDYGYVVGMGDVGSQSVIDSGNARVAGCGPLTNWSLEPLLMALLRTETLTVVAPRTLCQHPSLLILTFTHII